MSEALEQYLSTTAAHDAPGFNALLDPDYTVVLPGGTNFIGKTAGGAFITRFFARTDWTQSFKVINTSVKQCKTATTLLDSTYSDADGPVRLVIGLTWVRRHGEWLVLLDQNTVVGG